MRLAICFLLFTLTTCVTAADRPNFLWLVSEDNSTHYLKLYFEQGAETPEMAKLAAHGLIFDHAFSNAPVCSVARTTLITSCYGPRIGTQFHRRAVAVPLPEGLKMFPAYLRDAGYYTTNNSKKDYNAIETEGTWDESSAKADWRGRKPGQSFFHMQSFSTSHESSLHFSEDAMRTQATNHDPNEIKLAPYHPDTAIFRYTHARYLDNIQKVDAEFGNILRKLEEDQLLEDTFIFCFGDHGGVLPRGKGYAYESGLHVPLVVRVPQRWRHLVPWDLGSRVQGFVSFVDFGPTLLNLANLEVPKQVDGRPFLGTSVTAAEVDGRDEAWGYADRFDEKLDLVRTLRKGKYEYVRSYQPFNFDGLHNGYRYNMLAYRQWRDLFQSGQLNEVQQAFFKPRPAEMLFDLETDPFEVKDLSQDPLHQTVLNELRARMQQQVKSLPDLSFFPESYLVAEGFADPVTFGQEQKSRIGSFVDVADLSLISFSQANDRLVSALTSSDPWERYWGLIVGSSFGSVAKPLVPLAKKLGESDESLLVRTRAAEFLGLLGERDPEETLRACLASTESGTEAALILNSVVLLRDGKPGYAMKIAQSDIHPKVRQDDSVIRRLAYLDPNFTESDNTKAKERKKKTK